MLSIALEKQKDLFYKRCLAKVVGMFSKTKLDGGSIMAMMGPWASHGIHSYTYVWLWVEREEEVEVPEEQVQPPLDTQAGNSFYFDICGSEPESPVNEGKPRCICHLPWCF